MKLDVIAKAYFRAVKRGSRNMDGVPASICPYVEKMLEKDAATKGE